MLADIYDIQITEVDDLILQHIVDFRMTGMEFDQYTNAEGYATQSLDPMLLDGLHG